MAEKDYYEIIKQRFEENPFEKGYYWR